MQGRSGLFFLSVFSLKSYVWYLVDSVAKLHQLRYPATLLVGFTLRTTDITLPHAISLFDFYQFIYHLYRVTDTSFTHAYGFRVTSTIYKVFFR